MVRIRSPLRISFFGGGTDYPAWFHRHGGSVLATSIDKYVHIECRSSARPTTHPYIVREAIKLLKITREIEINVRSDLPLGTGMGSSSSFVVGLLRALHEFQELAIDRHKLAMDATLLEQLEIPYAVGRQDQVTAAFGGFNRVNFLKDGKVEVLPLDLKPQRREELEKSLMLFGTGLQRPARLNRNIAFDERKTELSAMKTLLDQAETILSSDSSLDDFGVLLDETWKYKRRLNPQISHPEIDRFYRAALLAGASGGKLLGAGGGGYFLLFVKPERQELVKNRLTDFNSVEFKFEIEGCHSISSPQTIRKLPAPERGVSSMTRN